jgi:hypothetical protein
MFLAMYARMAAPFRCSSGLLALAFALSLFACVSRDRVVKPRDGGVVREDAGVAGAGSGAAGAAGSAGSAGTTGSVSGVCTVGQDQSCNDSPIISSLKGRCLADGRCECHPPSTINPRTGLCQ